MFAHFYGGSDEQLNAVYNNNHGNICQMKFTKAKVIKVKKEMFIKFIVNKNKLLNSYATEKLNFLKLRISYLAKNANKNIHNLLYKN